MSCERTATSSSMSASSMVTWPNPEAEQDLIRFLESQGHFEMDQTPAKPVIPTLIMDRSCKLRACPSAFFIYFYAECRAEERDEDLNSSDEGFVLLLMSPKFASSFSEFCKLRDVWNKCYVVIENGVLTVSRWYDGNLVEPDLMRIFAMETANQLRVFLALWLPKPTPISFQIVSTDPQSLDNVECLGVAQVLVDRFNGGEVPLLELSFPKDPTRTVSAMLDLLMPFARCIECSAQSIQQIRGFTGQLEMCSTSSTADSYMIPFTESSASSLSLDLNEHLMALNRGYEFCQPLVTQLKLVVKENDVINDDFKEALKKTVEWWPAARSPIIVAFNPTAWDDDHEEETFRPQMWNALQGAETVAMASLSTGIVTRTDISLYVQAQSFPSVIETLQEWYKAAPVYTPGRAYFIVGNKFCTGVTEVWYVPIDHVADL